MLGAQEGWNWKLITDKKVEYGNFHVSSLESLSE